MRPVPSQARAASAPAAALAAALLTAACGPADNDPGPGGVTVGEARALDEAAEMLDARQPPSEAEPGKEADGEEAASAAR